MNRRSICAGAALVAALVLNVPAPAHALLLCAAIDSDTGQAREGATIKLRSACKTKKDGSPAEVALGTTEDLAKVGGFQAVVTKVANVEQGRLDNDGRARDQVADLTGLLGELYAIQTTGSSQSADAGQSVTTLGQMITDLDAHAAGIDTFNQAPPASPNSGTTGAAKDACNAWIDKVLDTKGQMKTELQAAQALASIYDDGLFGFLFPFPLLLADAGIGNLQKIRDTLEGPEYQECSEKMKDATNQMQQELDEFPEQYGDEAEEHKGNVDGDTEYIEDLQEIVRLVLEQMRRIADSYTETMRQLWLL